MKGKEFKEYVNKWVYPISEILVECEGRLYKVKSLAVTSSCTFCIETKEYSYDED